MDLILERVSEKSISPNLRRLGIFFQTRSKVLQVPNSVFFVRLIVVLAEECILEKTQDHSPRLTEI